MIQRDSQQGAVLLTTLFVTAVVCVIAACIAFKEHLFFSNSYNAQQWQVCYEDWQLIDASLVRQLVRYAQGQPEESLFHDHAFQFGGRTFFTHIVDAQSRFNINNLAGISRDHAWAQSFTSIARHINPKLSTHSAQTLTDNLILWLSNQASPQDNVYLREHPPYFPAHSTMKLISDVRLVYGFNTLMANAWPAFTQAFIALPSNTLLNRATASPIILSALNPQLTLSQAQAYHSCATSSPSISRCDQQFPVVSKIPSTTRSQYFIITAHVPRTHQPDLHFSTLVYLQPVDNHLIKVQTVWQRFYGGLS